MRIDGQLQPPAPSKSKKALLLLLTFTVIGAIAVAALWRRDFQEAPPRRLGSVFTAAADGRQRLYYIMEERRARRGTFDTRGLHAYHMPYSIFTLHSRQSRDGSEPSGKIIARTDGGTVDHAHNQISLHLIQEPEILGPEGDILWLWNLGELEARNLATLEVVWTADKLRELNPGLAQFLPTDRKYYKVLGRLNRLVFKGSDARFFQIDPRQGRITPIDDAKLAALAPDRSNRAQSAFDYLWPESDSLWGTSVGALQWSSTVDDASRTWYGLLAADEKPPAYWSDPRYGFGTSGEVARFMHTTRVTIDHSTTTGMTSVNLDTAAAKKLSDERFLMGGFLRRPNADTLWFVSDTAVAPGNAERDVAQPPSAVFPKSTDAKSAAPPRGDWSLLILHKQALGKESPWLLTRIGRDGKTHWTTSTHLADLQHLCESAGAVVFTGYADFSEPTNNRPDLMTFIDEVTGKAKTLNLETNVMAEWN